MSDAPTTPTHQPIDTPPPLEPELTIGANVPADRLRMREAIKALSDEENDERVHEILEGEHKPSPGASPR